MITALKKYLKRDKKDLIENKTFFIKKLDGIISDFNLIFDVGAYKGSFVDSVMKFNTSAQFHCF